MAENFKGTSPSAHCIIDCTEHYYQRPSSLRPSPFTSKFSLSKLKAPCYICSNSSSNFYQQFMAESISDKEIGRRICSLNEVLSG